MAATGFVHGQAGAVDGFSPQVQERERQLLQGLTPDQLQLVAQNAALFEGMPDPGIDPQGALLGLLGAPGIRGMNRDEAAFAVMAVAGRHMDEDLRELANGIIALSEARQALLKRAGELGAVSGGSGKTVAAPTGEEKGRQGVAADGDAALGSAGPALPLTAGQAPAVGSLRTAFFKLEYWHAAPLTAGRDLRAMSQQECLAEAALLKARLTEFDGCLMRMREQIVRGQLKRRQFVKALEGMAQGQLGKDEKR
jgi:hypothetical protein